MNREVLGELIINSTDSMYRVAKSILKTDEDCHDAISETIVKAYAKIHTLRKDEFAKTWLIRILMNECYGILKRAKRIVPLEEYEDMLESKEKEDYRELYQAIQRLPDKLRIIIILYYLEGYSVRECAMVLKISETAVKKRLLRGRNTLKGYLEEA